MSLYVLIAAAILLTLAVYAIGLIRGRMGRLYWQTHPGGEAGYKRDCMLLAWPLEFIALAAAFAAGYALEVDAGVFIFILPLGLAGTVAILTLPKFRKASARILAAHKPLESTNVR